MTLTDLIPANPSHANRPPTVPSCQYCGINARADPDLTLNERRQCARCAAEWESLEAAGLSGRMVTAAWAARRDARMAERRALVAGRA